ncbi:MAG: ribonuclease J [Candidatus Taylorbacteria bacterium]|nr:ribonuclease J [Candidatus Taylorbacteria bacterium]
MFNYMDKDKPQKPPFRSRAAGSAGADHQPGAPTHGLGHRPSGSAGLGRPFHSAGSLERTHLRKPSPSGPRPAGSAGLGPRPFDAKTPRGFGGKKLDRPRHRGAARQGYRGGLPLRLGGKKTDGVIPNLAPGNIRVIPLGGVEQIGQNMTMVEFGGDIIVIDAGFQFKEEDTPGIDFILPNTKYLEERKNKIRALIITHGHLDHICGIPYIMERIGNPPLYTRALTSVMVRKRQEEFPHLPPLDIKVVEKEDRIKIGALSVKFFSVTHTIPDSMGVIIETPLGSIVNPGDIKLDHIDGSPTEAEEKEYERFKNENVLFLMMDSTNVDNPGFSTPERLVHKNLDEIIKHSKGRLIIGTFASQLERMMAIIHSAEKYGKKVVIDGRSMKNNIEIVKQMGMLKVKKDTLILPEEMESYPPDRIVALVTGAQGDEFAALMRMSNKSHKHFKITPRDSVLLSSSIIPGNERAVQKLKDNLARQGAKIIHYRSSDVYIHSTGHGNRGELEWLHRHIKPKFFMPMHGTHYMLRVHEELAKSVGMPPENIIVPDNGTVIEIQNGGQKLVRLKEKAPSGLVLVDGFSVGDVQEVVIRDRQMLAQDGMFVIIASVNSSNGRLKKSPDIISRGFVYLRESQDLLHQTRIIIKKTIEDTTAGMNPINFEYVKSVLTDNVGRFLFQKTAKRPIVIPVLLSV